jgi:hypothetical protein
LLPLHDTPLNGRKENEMNMNFETMGKTELRAACKEAGISYGKLNVAGMRAALTEAYAEGEAMLEDAAELDLQQNPEPVATAAEKRRDARARVNAAHKQAEAKKAAREPREERNGVKRPGPGLCRDVWDYLDKTGNAMPADLKDVASQKGWNFGNVTIELYQWRRFHGLGRPEKKAEAK